MEFVSWDDDIPIKWKVIKFMFQTTNQTTIRCQNCDVLAQHQIYVPKNKLDGGLLWVHWLFDEIR